MRGLLGLGLGAILLYLALRNVEWAQMRQAFRQASLLWALFSLPLLVLGFFLKGIRIGWIGEGKFKRVLVYTQGVALGLGINSFIPLRIGEVVKIFYLAKRTNVGALRAGLLVVMERVMDFSCLGILIIAVFLTNNTLFRLWLKNISQSTKNSGYGGLGLVFAAGALLAVGFTLYALNFKGVRGRTVEKWQEIKGRALSAIKEFRGRLAVAFCFSLLVWLVDILYLGILAHSFQIPIGVHEILFLQMTVTLAFVSSVSPGALGLYELVGVWALENMGYPTDQSLAFLLTAHGLIYLAMFSGTALVVIKESWVLKLTQTKNQTITSSSKFF